MVILFNVKKLARKLARNELRETHKLFYFIVPMIFVSLTHAGDLIQLGMGYPLYESPITPLRIADAVFDTLLICFGFLGMWLINRQGDQRYFLERVICLSFPLLAWVQVFKIAFNLLGFYVLLRPGSEWLSPETHSLITVGVHDSLMIVYFLSLGHWLKKTSHKQV